MKIEYISSDGIHRAEKLAIEKMREEFNASQFSQRWHGFAGFEMIDRDTRDREIDLVLLTEDRLILIELKDWNGVVTVAGDQWYLNGDYRGRSPVKVTSAKARILASRLKKRLSGAARNSSVDYFVVFSGNATFGSIPADEQPLVLSLGAFLRLSSHGVYTKYFKPSSTPYSPCQDVNTFRLLFRGNDFTPTAFSFHNYRITGDAIFAHPLGLYNEFKAIKKDDANYQALLRRWDFSSMSGQADTIEERAKVALREHQVIGFVREHNEALEPVLPVPLWSPTKDDVQVDFCELYRLPGKQSRLSEFVNKFGPQLTPSDRVSLVKVLLSHFASLHDIKVAHRDIGDHSIWLELPTKVSLSSFVTAYFPEAITIGELRSTLRASNVSIPEDVEGLGADVKSDPFRRDVYMLGVVCHYLLFLKWPSRDSQLKIYLWDDTIVDGPFTAELSSWLSGALELVPTDRFANAREMLNGLNSIHCQPGDVQAVSLADFAPYETEALPLELYPVESTKKAGRTHIYLSSVGNDKVLVKLWYGLQPDTKAPEKSHGLLAFLEKCKRLKEQRPDGVPTVHDFGISPAGTYVVQSYIEGSTLDETLKSPLSLDRSFRVSQLLIESIRKLHRLGYEHGDISPRNIVLTTDGGSTFIDFVDPAVKGTRFTPAYVPLNHESVPLDQIDCYAVALICKELLNASTPAATPNAAGVRREIDACLDGEFQVFLLDRIADEIEKTLQPITEPKPENTVIVRLRHQPSRLRKK